MKLIGCLFVLLLFGVIFAFSLLRGVFRLFLGGMGKGTTSTRHYSGTNPNAGDGRTTTSQPTPKKKLIGEDEGEYVDFEEIKENKP